MTLLICRRLSQMKGGLAQGKILLDKVWGWSEILSLLTILAELFLGVRLLVLKEVGPLYKAFPAVTAHVGLLPGVDDLMQQQL